MSKTSSICLVAIVLTASSTAALAQSRRVQVGSLTCDVAPSVGLILGSQQQLKCLYRSRTSKTVEAYAGTITRVGLDVGITGGGKMLWAVYAPSKGVGSRALAGNYAGASGEITVGAGVGANALLGGSNRSIALQPLSVKGQAGANLALGVASLNLQ